MPTEFVTAKQIVEELGLFGSKFGVHRAVKRGELPKPRRYGNRYLWLRSEICVPTAEYVPPPRVIKRRKQKAAG